MSIVETLRSLRACDLGIRDVAGLHQLDPADAWAKCQHPRHMLWLLGEVRADRRVIVSIACDIAETALPYVQAGEERPRIAIDTARRWARGEATLEDVRTARSGAWAAAAAAYAADAAAAAYAADAAAAAYADRTVARARHADIIRAHVSYADLEPMIAAKLARAAA